MICRPDRWLLGLPALAAIAALAIWRIEPAAEAGLTERVTASLAASGLASRLEPFGARAVVAGRDVDLVVDAALPEDLAGQAKRAIGAPVGTRLAGIRVEVPAQASPFRFVAERRGAEMTLSGSVPPGAERAAILARARALPGLGHVRDRLASALGAPDGFPEAADALIAVAGALPESRVALDDRVAGIAGAAPDAAAYRAAFAALARLPAGYAAPDPGIVPPRVGLFAWTASRRAGELVLDGNVPSERARAKLLAEAKAAWPDAVVADRMATARGLDDGIDFPALSGWALNVLSRLESGRIGVSGRDVRIDGDLAARDLAGAVDQAGRAVPAGTRLGGLAIRIVPARPYRFAARRVGPRIVLTGYVPSDADRMTVGDLGRRRFPLDALDDALHIADGAPADLLDGVRLALDGLSLLSGGEAVLTDRRVRLAGATPYAELAERLRRDWPASAPPGWKAEAEIAALPAERPLDPGLCGDLLADAARRHPIAFETGQADLAPAARKALDPLVEILRRCGQRRIQVVVEGGPAPGSDVALRRAEAVRAALDASGTPAALSAAERPPPPTRPEPGRITFEVLP